MKLCSLFFSTILLASSIVYGQENNFIEKASDQSNTLSGKVYIDADHNSILSSNDTGLQGTRVFAYEDVNKNGLLDDSDRKVGTTETDANGDYTFEIPAITAHTSRTKIAASSDDAVQNEPGGIMILDSESEPGIREIGLRFLDLDIPQGSKIESASLKISIAHHAGEFIEIIVKGQASDNPSTFTNQEYNIWDRPRTQITNEFYSSVIPNEFQELEIDGFEAIIQEIIDRPGWEEGNALVLIIADFFADMYMYDGGFPAELIINYEDQSDVTYIVTPDLSSVDPVYQLSSEQYQLVTVAINGERNNIDFGFNQPVISSTDLTINELNLATMEIWPKPTTGPINILLNGLQLDQTFSVNVFSINGKLVTTEKINIGSNNQAQCNLSYLSKGTYIVQLTDGSSFFSDKVILQ